MGPGSSVEDDDMNEGDDAMTSQLAMRISIDIYSTPRVIRLKSSVNIYYATPRVIRLKSSVNIYY